MRMPTCLVLALLTMQPCLEAEESILNTNRIAMGTGSLKDEDAGRLARQWSRAAHPHAAPTKADPGSLRALGFAVKKIPRQKKA